MSGKKNSKKDILKSSINLMYLRGYNGTSVKDITDASGIPKGSFYNYFKDKEHYAVDALEFYYNENSNNRMTILKDKNLKPLDRITEFYKNNALLIKNRDYTLGCFAGNLTQEMAEVSELISDATSNFFTDMVTLVLNNLLEAKQNNELHNSIDPKVLANFIVSSWQGCLVRLKADSKKEVLDHFFIILQEMILK